MKKTFKKSKTLNINNANVSLINEAKPHLYNGNGMQNIKCKDCSKDTTDFIHYRNAGAICDNYKGPCSCGAWH